MLKKLRKGIEKELYHLVDGVKVFWKNENMRGDFCYINGNCSSLRGDCSGLNGDCSDLKGNCSGIMGDLDECQISDEERAKGIDIRELIAEGINGEKEVNA